MKLAIAYIRVSTRLQARSGLGIEAQRAAITRFANTEGRTSPADLDQGALTQMPLSKAGGN